MSTNIKKTFLLPPDVTTALAQLAAEEDASQTEIVTAAIRMYRDQKACGRPGSLISQATKDTLEGLCQMLENNLNHRSNQLLSSMAIQLYVLQRVVSDNLQIDGSLIDDYTQEAVEMLQRNNRVFRMQEFIGR